MSQADQRVVHSECADPQWRGLYIAGGLAPLIALVFYSSQFILLAFGDLFSASAEDWFALAQRSKLLTLWYLNALDILSVALLGIMFLALCVALRRVRPSILIAINGFLWRIRWSIVSLGLFGLARITKSQWNGSALG